MDQNHEERIRRACERLVFEYSHHADFGAAEAAAGCYLPDGRLEIDGRQFAGRAAIRQRLSDMPGDQLSRHFCTNVVIEVIDDSHAEGTAYVLLYRGRRTGGQPGPIAMDLPLLIGHYEDRFVRSDEGWRFAARTLNVTFRRESRR